MKLSTFFLIIVVIFNFTNLNAVENNEELKNKISKNIRCLICQGQSIYDSQSDFSISMRLVIKKKLEEGLTEKEIYDFLKDLSSIYPLNFLIIFLSLLSMIVSGTP